MVRMKSLLPLTISLFAVWNPGWGQNHFSVNSSTVALWTFNAHSGDTFTDASPNAFSLSNADNFGLTPSPYDSAAVFTGTAAIVNSYLVHANTSALTIGGTGQITYEVRLYLTQGQSGAGASGGWVLGTYDGVSLEIGSDGHFQAGGQKVRNGIGYWINEESVAGVVPLNRWFDLAVAFDQTTGQAYGYIDGAPVQLYTGTVTYPVTDPFRISTGSFFVGNDGQDNYQFSGTIDEIRVSNSLVLGVGPALIAGNPPPVPTNLSYSTNPAIYAFGVPISNNVPTVSGTVTHYSVTPALPTGLKLDSATGIISGTPVAPATATNYTILASNAVGFTTVILNITVPAPSPPGNLSYSKNPAVYGVGVAIAVNNPTVQGTVPINYSITPALPSGLTLNASSGVISGTPTTASPAAYYSITATNAYGAASTSVNITVIAAPAGFTYSVNPAQYLVGAAIVPDLPTVSGAVTGYTVTPALPQGLTLNVTTGVISGTPLEPAVATNYTVTATNAQGSTAMATVNISVLLAPSNLSYSTNPANYAVGKPIIPNEPSVQGTGPFTYSVSPALPTGLNLNTSTGTISGTPTNVWVAADYVVTAGNPAGSTTATLLIATPLAILHPKTDSRMLTLNISGSSTVAFSLPENVPGARVEIFDMKGLKVWEGQTELGGAEGSLVWDGRMNGHAISGGLYFARVTLIDAQRNPIINSTVQRILYTP